MDKLTPLIDWLKKNKFWLGSALLVLAMIGTWFLGVGQVETEKKIFASAIKTQISAVEAIKRVSAEEGVAAHPNSATEQGMKNEIGGVLDDLIKTWKVRHAKQQAMLKWPTAVIGNEEFVKAFSKYDPPEKYPEKYTGGNQMESYLTLYRDRIPKQMIVLAEMIKTKWNYDPKYEDEANKARLDGGFNGGFEGGFSSSFEGGFENGGLPGGMRVGNDPNAQNASLRPEELNRFAVVWNDANQALWYQKLTRFHGLDDHVHNSQDPTPLQVYMLQQDLWLLEAMFRIIHEVNGDVTANDLAVIKRIDHVAFGRDVRRQLGQLTSIDRKLGALSPADAGGMAGGMMSPEAMYSEGMDGPMGVPGADGELGVADPNVFNIFGSLSPYHGRYLDVNFEPLSAQLVRSILTAKELPPEHLELIVAKRVPVRIALRMDERKIPDFMTAAANSPFAFEINQIRLNRHISGEGIEFNGGGNGASNAATVASGALAGAGADFGMEKGYGAPGSGMMDRPGMGGSGMVRPGMGGSGMGIPMGQNSLGEIGQENLVLKPSPVETRTNYDVDVEFYGIIKIYNPVREKFLRTAAGQQVDEQPAETPDPNQAAKSQPAIDKRQTSPQDLRKS